MGAALADGADLEGAEGRVSLREHAQRNRAIWSGLAADYVEAGRAQLGARRVRPGASGMCRRPSSGVLGDVAGQGRRRARLRHRVLLRRGSRGGARGRSGSTSRPSSSRRRGSCRREYGLEFPLVEASAEDVPLPGRDFDLAVSEYGASHLGRSVPLDPRGGAAPAPGRRARLPRQRRRSRALLSATRERADETSLQRPYFGMHRFEWPDDGSVEFHLGDGEWIRLLRASGFEVERSARDAGAGGRRADTVCGLRAATGRGAGRPRRSGGRASARERRRPRLRSCSRRRRRSGGRSSSSSASRSSVVAPRYEELAAGRDPVASEHARGKARSVAGERGRAAGARRRHAVVLRRATCLGKPADAGEAEAMLEAARRADARGRVGALRSSRRAGRRRTRRRRASRFRPLTAARPGRRTWRRASGRAAPAGTRSRARRRPRRAHRGRLPERRRPPGRPPRSPLAERFPGTYGFG